MEATGSFDIAKRNAPWRNRNPDSAATSSSRSPVAGVGAGSTAGAARAGGVRPREPTIRYRPSASVSSSSWRYGAGLPRACTVGGVPR